MTRKTTSLDMLHPYPAYKDSGVEWIGEIPEWWELRTVREIFENPQEIKWPETETNVLSLSYGNVIQRDVSSNDGLLPASFSTYQMIKAGDIIIRPTDLQNDQRSLRTGLATQDGIITSAYIRLRPKGFSSTYCHQLLNAADRNKVFYKLGGGLRQSLKFDALRHLKLPFAPKEEQTAIAAFLDHETARIDELVREQELLLEDLAEKRRATITQAVTKGLDPSVPMKDSGVEWIGEIPEGWEIRRAKNALKFQKEISRGQGKRLALTLKGVIERDEDDVNGLQPASMDSYQIFKENDLVFKLIDLQNIQTSRVGIVPKDGIMSPAYIRMSPNNQETPKFLYWFFYSLYINQIYNRMGEGIRQSLKAKEVLRIPVLAPSIKEQAAIAKFLDNETANIDALSREVQTNIKDLKLLRSALITATTTGKIMVPEIQEKIENSNTTKEKTEIEQNIVFFYEPETYLKRIMMPLDRRAAAHDGNMTEETTTFLRKPVKLHPEDEKRIGEVENIQNKFIELLRATEHSRARDPKTFFDQIGLKIITGPKTMYLPEEKKIVIREELNERPLTHQLWHEVCHHIFQSMVNGKALSHFADPERVEEKIVRQATYELCIPKKDLEQSKIQYPLHSERTAALAKSHKVSNQLAHRVVADDYPRTFMALVMQDGHIISGGLGKNGNPGTPKPRFGETAEPSDVQLMSWTQNHPNGIFYDMDIAQSIGRAEGGRGRKWSGDLFHDVERNQIIISCYKID